MSQAVAGRGPAVQPLTTLTVTPAGADDPDVEAAVKAVIGGAPGGGSRIRVIGTAALPLKLPSLL